MLYISVRGKYPQRFEKKKFLAKPNHPYYPSNVEWSTPKGCCRLFKLVYYFSFLALNAG